MSVVLTYLLVGLILYMYFYISEILSVQTFAQEVLVFFFGVYFMFAWPAYTIHAMDHFLENKNK